MDGQQAVYLPVIPETVTVHLGAPDAQAENVTVSFPDYIKNVASSEIYPTWPEAALVANIYAQISFALNRIYTEYYRSRGYDFDITNSTAYDQAFVNGRNFFDTIISIVDNIFNSYIRRRGYVEPLFAQYCNGTTVTCDGLSQWGSVDLAEQNYFAYEILTSYYGDDIEIVRNVPIEGVAPSYPQRSLQFGSGGNAVAIVQTRLNRISTNYPSIPKIPTVDGYFGIETRDAVLEFQRIFNLDADGVVGRATWYRIIFIYNAVKRLNDLSSEGLRIEEVTGQFPEVLEEGQRGPYISLLQYQLNYIAEYENLIEPIEVDGIFGPKTAAAVEAFQRAYGIEPTGVVDEATYVRLFDVYYSIINSIPDTLFENTARPYPGFILSLGMSNEYVGFLQEYLDTISNSFADVPRVEINGVFGVETREAVLAFQEIFGITPTGTVSLGTWTVIASVYDDIRSGEYTGTNQSPGTELYEEGEAENG